jgi:hypothetical protein
MSDVAMPAPTYDYDFHPLAEMFPLIEGEDFSELVEDIATRGLLVPIMLYQGKILDGRNRYRAAKEAGYKFTTKDFRELSSSLDPEGYVISTNIHRRQLTNKQKREVIGKLIEAKPNASDRAIARLAGVDNKTVASVRQELSDRVNTFVEEWDDLSPPQRQEFVLRKGDELRSLLA